MSGELQDWLRSLGLDPDEAEETQNSLVREGYKTKTSLSGTAQPTVQELQAMGIPLRVAKLIEKDLAGASQQQPISAKARLQQRVAKPKEPGPTPAPYPDIETPSSDVVIDLSVVGAGVGKKGEYMKDG